MWCKGNSPWLQSELCIFNLQCTSTKVIQINNLKEKIEAKETAIGRIEQEMKSLDESAKATKDKKRNLKQEVKSLDELVKAKDKKRKLMYVVCPFMCVLRL